MSSVKIRIASKADQNEILEGFRQWYWPYEPLSVGFEVTTPSAIEEETFSTVPEKGLSLIATLPDLNEKPCGFLVNGLDYPGLGMELQEKFKDSNCKRMFALVSIMDEIEKKCNIFKKYETDKSFHFLSVAVDPEYRGKSIGYKLFQRGFQMAKTLGFKIVSVDCSSSYSIAIAERCNMEFAAEILYADYKDSDGNQIFKPPEPHMSMKRFVKVL